MEVEKSNIEINQIQILQIKKFIEENKLVYNNVNLTELCVKTPNLTLEHFIKETNINIDHLYIDRFWNSIEDDKWILFDDELLRWVGFEGQVNKARSHCMQLIKKNKLEYKIIDYETEVPAYGGTSKYETKKEKYLKQINFIIIPPDSFKNLCMQVETKKGYEIRGYYTLLEKIFKQYDKYQKISEKWNNNQKQIELQHQIQHKAIELETKEKEIADLKAKLPQFTGYIYEIKNNITEDLYIGQTVQIPVHKRFEQHMNEALNLSKNKFIRNIIQYGTKTGNFTYKILDESKYISQDDLDAKEKALIEEACKKDKDKVLNTKNTIEPVKYIVKQDGSIDPNDPEGFGLVLDKIRDKIQSNKWIDIRNTLEQNNIFFENGKSNQSIQTIKISLNINVLMYRGKEC